MTDVYEKDRGDVVLWAVFTIVPFTIFVVSMRLYTRLRIVHSTGLDDLMIMVAMVSMDLKRILG